MKPVFSLVRYSPEICELSRVINHNTEDFISTIKFAAYFKEGSVVNQSANLKLGN